jgi:hypothetical protein
MILKYMVLCLGSDASFSVYVIAQVKMKYELLKKFLCGNVHQNVTLREDGKA